MFTAALDTSVLWPSLQRDFLLSLAVELIYRPVWSQAILDELQFHEARKLEHRDGVPAKEAEARAARLVGRMSTAFADALVEGWEPLDGTYGLPDPDDEHVVAAAYLAGAGVIVTSNLKDFPAHLLPKGLIAQSPQDFARDAVDISPQRSLAAIDAIAARSGVSGPVRSRAEILAILADRYSMDEAVALLIVEADLG